VLSTTSRACGAQAYAFPALGESQALYDFRTTEEGRQATQYGEMMLLKGYQRSGTVPLPIPETVRGE